ncbi:hypothetical protein J6590_103240, partial [Homalodisca vitripennis]
PYIKLPGSGQWHSRTPEVGRVRVIVCMMPPSLFVTSQRSYKLFIPQRTELVLDKDMLTYER